MSGIILYLNLSINLIVIFNTSIGCNMEGIHTNIFTNLKTYKFFNFRMLSDIICHYISVLLASNKMLKEQFGLLVLILISIFAIRPSE